ncbi:MAG: hypothetical protein R2854_29355 [Caldilineaceae bacterium]
MATCWAWPSPRPTWACSSALDDHAAAVAVYREALGTYQRLGNRELAAATLLNPGMAHHLMDERLRRSLLPGDAGALCGQQLARDRSPRLVHLAEAHAS